MRRRSTGESLTDAEVITAHAELMPELGHELQKLALIETAERLADHADSDQCGCPSFPGYEDIRELHRGGQGVVYRARQRGTRQDVAIKVLRGGPFAHPRDRARFEREIELLGRLNHPGIVGVHESGAVMGCFYYVMNYIEGRPLDSFVKEQRLDLRDSVALVAKVCDAVNAAHLLNIIHRDLKPANIRVDQAGQPHIVDFGLAKVPADEPPPGAATTTGQFVGSVRWAAPEQAQGRTVDVRTDVYALGLLLYHLLADRFPYDVSGALPDVLNRITHDAPLPLRGAAARIDSDVETIVMKCLEKDKERRYQNAGKLASELRRFLADEPINAKRDSGWYVFRKTVRRHRLPVATACVFVLLLFCSLVFMTTARNRAVRARQQSTADAETARRATEFLVELFEMSDPANSRGKTVTVLEMLAAGERRLRAELHDQPAIRATLMDAIGRVYHRLAQYDRALPLLEEALDTRIELFGSDDLRVAESWHHLASLRTALADYPEAERCMKEALRIRTAHWGAQHHAVATTMSHMAAIRLSWGYPDQAEKISRKALTIGQATFSADDPELAEIINILAHCAQTRGRYTEAEPLYRDVLAIRRAKYGDDHPAVATAITSVATAVHRLKRYEDANVLFRQALEIRERILDQNHPAVIDSLNELAISADALGQRERAIALMQQVIERSEAALGSDHPTVALYMMNLAHLAYTSRQRDIAEEYFRKALTIIRARTPDHARVANILYWLGRIRLYQGRPAEAEPILRECLEVSRRVEHPEGAIQVAIHESSLAEALLEQERYAEAETLLLGVWNQLTSPRSAEGQSRDTFRIAEVEALRRLVKVYRRTGRADEAAKWQSRLDLLEK